MEAMLGMKFWQEVILYIGIACIVFMVLYPPWYIEGKGEFGVRKLYAKYHFIFPRPSGHHRIDYPRYLWPIGVACFMWLLALLEFIPDRPKLSE
jgi:hypothetical protein